MMAWLDQEDSVFDSTIITTAAEQSFVIKQICQSAKKSLRLLYRGSIHSFDAKACHFKVNGNENTVTFIHAEDGVHEQEMGELSGKKYQGKKFGGFSSIVQSSDGKYSNDPTAFVFSLTNGAKGQQAIFNVKSEGTKAVGHFGGRICQFGMGDIYIDTNCNKTTQNRAAFGRHYELPSGIEYDTAEANSLLAGSLYFKVKEVEIFALV